MTTTPIELLTPPTANGMDFTLKKGLIEPAERTTDYR